MSHVPLMPRTLTPFYDHWRPGPVDPRRVRCGGAVLDLVEDEGRAPDPVAPVRGPHGFWGQRWIERLAGVWPGAGPLSAGRRLFQDRLVLDLAVSPGRIDALVGDRRLQRVAVHVRMPPEAARRTLLAGCAGQIPSTPALLDGDLPAPALALLTDFALPSPGDLDPRCACSRSFCAHAAAALHALATRLDHDPTALFHLRGPSPAEI